MSSHPAVMPSGRPKRGSERNNPHLPTEGKYGAPAPLLYWTHYAMFAGAVDESALAGLHSCLSAAMQGRVE
jgi:hypothetical protein